MAFLIEVKKRIQSTDNTRKITRAMQLVAANKMKTFQNKALAARRYAWALLEALAAAHVSFKDTSFGQQRNTGSTLFVLLTSDKGLCGALNHRLIDALFESSAWKSENPSERMLITIGRKSWEAAHRLGVPVVQRFEAIPEELKPFESLRVIDIILKYWEEGKCRRIILVSPHYVSPFVVHTTQKTYLPFGEDMIKSHLQWRDAADQKEKQYTKERHLYFEPSEEEVIEAFSLQLAETLFTQAFFELKASEYSSRMVAMKQATEAADDMIKDLTLEYNKVRQSQITQQLAELAAGQEAMAK